MHAYSPRLYSFFGKNLGGSIKSRAQKWIDQIRPDEEPMEIIIVSAMAGAMKILPIGEYSQNKDYA